MSSWHRQSEYRDCQCACCLHRCSGSCLSAFRNGGGIKYGRTCHLLQVALVALAGVSKVQDSPQHAGSSILHRSRDTARQHELHGALLWELAALTKVAALLAVEVVQATAPDVEYPACLKCHWMWGHARQQACKQGQYAH